MKAALIGLDWGTSRLRACLLDARGTVVERRASAHGLTALPEGGFDAALAAITHGWPACPRLACGMVGARGGWREVDYVDVPADADDVAGALGQVIAADGRPLWIVPGVRNRQRPEVMRGEETQVLGALARVPALRAASTLILPGTHCKWVTVRDGRMVDVRTVMTGELFALLLRHSLLGQGIEVEGAHDPARFVDGVRAARDSGGAGGWSRLFAARALWLDGQLLEGQVAGWLSGLLIGEEIRSMLAADEGIGSASLQLIGEAGLCAHYRRALAEFSLTAEHLGVDSAASGLWQIAVRAGLVDSNGDIT